jgi:hypothetical protein
MGTMRTEMVDLRAEATAEARRLTAARAFMVEGDASVLAQAEGDATWIAFARRNRIRRALGSRLLLVWRVAFEDGGGALVESRLVPVVVELSRAVCGPQRRGWIETIVRELEPQIRAQIDAAGSDWRRAVDSAVRSFTSARTARERAIAARTAASGAGAFQPGLFDRRTERARVQLAAAAADTESAAAGRLASFARSNAISPRAAQLLLVLAPEVPLKKSLLM